MGNEIPSEVEQELESLSIDEIEFLEEEVFRAYDQAFENNYKHDADNYEEVALYERALETVSSIRRIKETLNDNKIQQAKEIQGLLDDK